MDESIRLDRKSFEALAGQTRVRILKSLLKRRKTLTELSHELGLSASTTKEHLEVLVDSELAQQVDEGRKWKYYELTRRGMSIVQPHELKVFIVLGLSIVVAGAALFNFFYALQPQEDFALGMGAAPETAVDAPRVAAAPADSSGSGEGAESLTMEAAGAEVPGASAVPPQDEAATSPSYGGPAFPFLEAGMAAAALLLFSWAFLYARGKGAV